MPADPNTTACCSLQGTGQCGCERDAIIVSREPTDAMVNAALNAWYKMDKAWKGDSSLKRSMRDAISAALKEASHAD